MQSSLKYTKNYKKTNRLNFTAKTKKNRFFNLLLNCYPFSDILLSIQFCVTTQQNLTSEKN